MCVENERVPVHFTSWHPAKHVPVPARDEIKHIPPTALSGSGISGSRSLLPNPPLLTRTKNGCFWLFCFRLKCNRINEYSSQPHERELGEMGAHTTERLIIPSVAERTLSLNDIYRSHSWICEIHQGDRADQTMSPRAFGVFCSAAPSAVPLILMDLVNNSSWKDDSVCRARGRWWMVKLDFNYHAEIRLPWDMADMVVEELCRADNAYMR